MSKKKDKELGFSEFISCTLVLLQNITIDMKHIFKWPKKFTINWRLICYPEIDHVEFLKDNRLAS